nr:hypothetical protein [Methylobacterium sp. Leaf122]
MEPLSHEHFLDNLYSGEIFFEEAGQISNLIVEKTRQSLAKVFPELGDFAKAQSVVGVGEVQRRTRHLSSKLSRSPNVIRCYTMLLKSLGFNSEKLLMDNPRLNATPSLADDVALSRFVYSAHRDTWFAQSQSQINLWIPIFDVDESCSFEFYRSYFRRPIINTSATFDLREARLLKEDPGRPHPAPSVQVDETSPLVISASAGTCVLFSSSHLHKTRRNTSGRTRFSLELRFLDAEHRTLGVGAPNVDNLSTGCTADEMLPADLYLPSNDINSLFLDA